MAMMTQYKLRLFLSSPPARLPFPVPRPAGWTWHRPRGRRQVFYGGPWSAAWAIKVSSSCLRKVGVPGSIWRWPPGVLPPRSGPRAMFFHSCNAAFRPSMPVRLLAVARALQECVCVRVFLGASSRPNSLLAFCEVAGSSGRPRGSAENSGPFCPRRGPEEQPR
eukprot:9504045-Pyramimonas_sp.AAC.3